MGKKVIKGHEHKKPVIIWGINSPIDIDYNSEPKNFADIKQEAWLFEKSYYDKNEVDKNDS